MYKCAVWLLVPWGLLLRPYCHYAVKKGLLKLLWTTGKKYVHFQTLPGIPKPMLEMSGWVTLPNLWNTSLRHGKYGIIKWWGTLSRFDKGQIVSFIKWEGLSDIRPFGTPHSAHQWIIAWHTCFLQTCPQKSQQELRWSSRSMKTYFSADQLGPEWI